MDVSIFSIKGNESGIKKPTGDPRITIESVRTALTRLYIGNKAFSSGGQGGNSWQKRGRLVMV